MKKKVHALRELLCFALVMLMIFTNMAPAYAWKPKTHVYAANLIIDEINKNNGYVEIEPFGLFQVVPEYYDLIKQYPEYYRAGSVGPDLFPDIIIGQTIIHTGNEIYTAGEFIDGYWYSLGGSSAYPKYIYDPFSPKDPANRYLEKNNKMQAKAFILGYMSHASGDYFGHSYVNHWSGGTWPDVTDGLNSSEKDIIRRHSVLEAYIDTMIPQEYKSNSKNTIEIPQRFVFDEMLISGSPNIGSMSNDLRMPLFDYRENVPPHLDLFFSIRDALRRRINKIDKNRRGDIIDKAAYALSLQFAQKAYCEAWVIDIDRGLGDWVAANERAAQQMLLENGNMDKYFDELSKWADKHALSMLGAPDVAVNILRTLGSVTDFIAGLFPKAVKDAIEDAKKGLINYFIRQITGINIEEYTKMLNPPLTELTNDRIFPQGSFDKIKVEMGNFNSSTDATKQDFIPFMNALTLTKLTLIGDDGIQELRRRAGSTDTTSTKKINNIGDTLTSFIYNMDYGYEWNENALIGSTFFLARGGEDQKLVTSVIFNLDGLKRPSFSDMTEGPIYVVTNKPYSAGQAPKVKVKYDHAPDQVNAVIGLYPADDYSTNTYNWKYIAGNINGEYEATIPQKGGKYHFRIYDNKYKILAVSDTIEVIEKDAVLESYFEPFSTERFEPSQRISVNFVNELKKSGFIALYKDSETDPEKIVDFKQKFTEKNSLNQLLTSVPETPGRYRYRAYDENMDLIATSDLIVIEGPPRQDFSEGSRSEVFKEGIIATWANSKGIGYRIFRSTSAKDIGISVTDFYITDNRYADVNVEPSTTYYYSVFPVLTEVNPFEGIEEKLGNAIYEFTITTGSEVSKSQVQKNSIVLQLDNPNISINGIQEEIDLGRGTTPLNVAGRSMVPIRSIVEAMGGTVNWEDSSQQITLTARGNTVKMWLGKKDIEVNGIGKTMDVAPFSKNGRTYVPIRFATENLNAKVDWIGSTNEIVITY